MDSVDLASELSGSVCSECGGVWIARSEYETWRTKQPSDLRETAVTSEIAVTDVKKAKICPQCGHLLLPYRVGHGLSFSIDYCGSCGGVWCDKNEWQALKAKNLHDNLHDIVSSNWQAAVRRADVQDAVEQAYKRQLGAAYERAADMRAWLRAQPRKSLLLAYLSDASPEAK